MSNSFKIHPPLLVLAAFVAAGGLACKKPSRTAQPEPAAIVASNAAQSDTQAVRQPDPGPIAQAGDAADAARKASAAKDAAYLKAANGALRDVHFNLDQAEVKESDKPILVTLAGFMKAYPQAKLLIDGNCDERGTVEYNLALGERRSNAALKYLVGLGVAEARLGTTTYGKEKPVCSAHVESCWGQNRRAHFTLN